MLQEGTVGVASDFAFNGVAYGHTNLESIYIPEGVRCISSYAFYTSLLTSVTIPNSVEYIGHMAFYGSKLTNVTIPGSVEYVGIGAFSIKDLTIIYCEAESRPDGWVENWYDPTCTTIIWGA